MGYFHLCRKQILPVRSLEQDFKYLYWTISKILLWNLITWKGIYMIDWVRRCTGTPYWELCGKLQQFGTKGDQAECNTFDSKSILWSFVFGSRTEPIWAPSQLSLCTHTPTARSTAISRSPCDFFPAWPLIFCQHTIHQVILPSPGTRKFICEHQQEKKRRGPACSEHTQWWLWLVRTGSSGLRIECPIAPGTQ